MKRRTRIGLIAALISLGALLLTGGAALATHLTTLHVDVCCAWNASLSDGDLTYKVSGGDAAAQRAVREAVGEWQTAVTGLTLTEVVGRTKANINVKFKKGGGQVQGQALRRFDGAGFVYGVEINISGSAFGSPNNVTVVKEIVRHETGHALGLGHSNDPNDLMYPYVTGPGEFISACDVNGVREANRWKLIEGSSTPSHPVVKSVPCP